MNEQISKKLNPTETIIKSLPAIIEAFVTFYGESERERITNKFQNMLIIGYSKTSNKKILINQSNKEMSAILIDKFLDKLTEDKDEREKLKKLFFDEYEFYNATMHPINKYMAYKDGTNQSDYNRRSVVDFLKKINRETTEENLDTLIKTGAFKNIDIFLPLYRQTLEEYQKYKEEIKLYTEYINSSVSLESSLEKKYQRKFLEEIKDLFTEEEYKEIEEKLADKYLSAIRTINAKTRNFLGYGINSTSLIDSFSQECDEVLLNGNSWRQSSIKNDRIEYYKNLGLDLGNDYESYINHPKAIELRPSQELIERIKRIKERLHLEKLNEYYSSLPEYKKNRERIDSLGLLDKDDGYDPSAYEYEGTAITTNLKKTEEGYIEFPLLLFYMGNMQEYYDSALIHELNHAYELCIQNVSENKYEMTCGWDILTGKINNNRSLEGTHGEREKRDYELLNEIINELIAQEISEILSQNDIYIFNTKEDKKIKGGTGYEKTLFLVRDFYENYKREIIESRKSGDMSKLFAAIGKENFESLNQLFHEFNDHFSGFKIYKVYEDIQKGIETEQIKIFKELITKRNKILKQMEEHNQQRKITI